MTSTVINSQLFRITKCGSCPYPFNHKTYLVQIIKIRSFILDFKTGLQLSRNHKEMFVGLTILQCGKLSDPWRAGPEVRLWCSCCWCAQGTSPNCSRRSCKSVLDIRGSSATGLYWRPSPCCASRSPTLSTRSKIEKRN